MPVILGMLLGPEMETSMRHALTISDGSWNIFYSSGLSIGLWAIAILCLILPTVLGPLLRGKMNKARQHEGQKV